MRPVPFLLVTVASLQWLWTPATADSDLELRNGAASSSRSQDLEVAKEVFQANCARCHGVTGAGDGPDAKRMFPKPRQLSEGIFKFRTTASGTPPTDEDLFRTISTGLPGSRMPDFQRLPEETRMNLVAYVKSLSPVFQEQQARESIDPGKDPGPKQANLGHGKEVYTQLGCASCHGESGRANGPSAPTLVDNWGEPIRAADLTQGWNYRAGSSPKEIVARVLTGIDGTPMPSYADALAVSDTAIKDVWHLAYYVHSLQEIPRWSRTVEAVKMPGALPATPEDPRWREVSRTDLRLSSNLYKEGEIQPATVSAISVQAVYNEEAVLFRLAWHDPNESRETPPDAVGLVFLPDRHLKFQIGSLRSWPASADAPPLTLDYWSANEPDKALFTNTRGFGFTSEAAYTEGRWTVLIQQPLQLFGQKGAIPKKPILMGIACWDGGNGEQGRRRANSNWVDLVLREEK